MQLLSTRTTAPARRPCSCPLPLPCQCSYPALLRARVRAGRVHLDGEPLLRNGHMLLASSVVAAALGAVFWVFATRWYSAETVGLSYAAVSAAGLLSALGRFNLSSVLVRFLPGAGRHTRRLVMRCYLASILASGLAAILFLLLIPWLSPSLDSLRQPVMAVAFVVVTAGYSLFVLQDGALTGLRRTGWVLGENAMFAVAKAGALAVCTVLAVGTGILVSWAAALLVTVLLTNVVLFRRAIPAHQRAAGESAPAPPRVARYAMADYLGNISGIAACSVVPLMVLAMLGAEQNAYYSLAWVIADSLYMAAYSMGSSLVVEAADRPDRLSEHARRMLRHTGLLVLGAVVVIVAGAPWLLQLFGPGYAEHGTTVLRLMALSALPNVVLSMATDVARVRRALGWMIGLQLVYAVLVIGLTAVLLPVLGLTGVGLAWLLAGTVLALPLLVALPRWLPSPDRRS
ncbi:lipopolysaccharide biosynthesis protein [Kitasatospora sp. NPDC048239]|uniref:lipopolysaccharide biosynthesis protein n=1 Tax=Kitasatospora sp. NPDC048239 TaxID=3364046 RepID=UPI003715CB8A